MKNRLPFHQVGSGILAKAGRGCYDCFCKRPEESGFNVENESNTEEAYMPRQSGFRFRKSISVSGSG